MALKLITEYNEQVQRIITEATGRKEYFIEGPFLQAEIKNRNGRVYPIDVMEREVNRYTKDMINENRAMGELGHPDSPQLNLPLVSHMITSLHREGNDYIGKAKILNTPNGNIVKALMDDHVTLGVSSRGLGSLKETADGHVVGSDFQLTTAADIVADPSAPNAFVRGIMEGREWVWDNGVLKEQQVAAFKREIEHAPAKKASERQLVEATTFEKFLNAIRVELLKPKKR